jgi:hypothetical protein
VIMSARQGRVNLLATSEETARRVARTLRFTCSSGYGQPCATR